VQINRIQIEEGFLSGLDLRLPLGLTTIIGARGTGKTSLIELIRFGLAARNHTNESKEESIDHAKSVLEDGEVAITIEDFVENFIVSRSATDPGPRSGEEFVPPVIFSQKEVETLGVSAHGRLALIDGFIRNRGASRTKEADLCNSIQSLHKEMTFLATEVDKATLALAELPAFRQQLVDIRERTSGLELSSKEASEKQKKLNELAQQISLAATRSASIERFRAKVINWRDNLQELVDADFPDQQHALGTTKNSSDEIQLLYANAFASVSEAAQKFKNILSLVEDESKKQLAARQKLEASARTLRAEIEKLVEGAGAVSRIHTSVLSKVSQLESIENDQKERASRVAAQRVRRDSLLDQLDALREVRFRERKKVGDTLNAALGPRIGVSIEKHGQYADYTRALADALRGSGLKYTEVSSRIAESVSPRELLQLVEDEDYTSLSSAASIPKDRAARIISVLREAGMGEVVTCEIEDNVRLRLLDGVEYKDISSLSAGQRCTVVLPIALQHRDRVLIIDQPEDHIDNAFITDTLIKAIKDRKSSTQTIVTTHNANIPVLGGAQLVVQMVSDGRNGTIAVCAPLDDPRAVEAISTVMEGGRQAFRDRANFYQAHEK
jgi:hypothetical protein